MLEVNNLVVNYGSIKGVDDISFYVNEGEIVTLIGANGAGKTSTLRALSGLNKVGAGTSIKFMGEELTKLTPHQIVAKGLCHVPEGRRIFYSMSVKENLLMGAWTDKDQAAVYLSQYFGISDSALVDELYSYMLDAPVNYLNYYVGYLEISHMKEQAEITLKDQFELKEFNRFILDIGPAPFTVIKPYFKEWLQSCRSGQ